MKDRLILLSGSHKVKDDNGEEWTFDKNECHWASNLDGGDVEEE